MIPVGTNQLIGSCRTTDGKSFSILWQTSQGPDRSSEALDPDLHTDLKVGLKQFIPNFPYWEAVNPVDPTKPLMIELHLIDNTLALVGTLRASRFCSNRGLNGSVAWTGGALFDLLAEKTGSFSVSGSGVAASLSFVLK